MYEYDDEQPRITGRTIGLALTACLIGVLGFVVLRAEPNQTLGARALMSDPAEAAALSDTVAPDLTTSTTSTTEIMVGASAPTTTTTTPTVAVSAPRTTSEVPDEAASPTTTSTPGTTTSTPDATAAAATGSDLGFPAAPDGTPLPVVVTYDSGTVQLAGFVPSEETRQRLVGLARANSQDDDVAVTDNLLINPAVPASVGIRVIELQSARFGEGAAQLTPMHIEQIDRVVGVMQALPHVSVLVIGHSDQRGDDFRNLMLSEDRAGAVVDYLVYLGIEPTRISMRGAGESDLLTLDDDANAFALNRRTEFIFYGVLL